MIPKLLINMASGYVSIQFKCKGPNHSVVTACATGAHAIGDAYHMIQRGDAKVMIAGGAESCLDAVCFAGFSKAKALCSHYNDKPQEASRPFDKDRDGFVMGEGCGVLILEDLEHAQQRGVGNIYAELKGYGYSAADAYHITSPSPDGRGAFRVMQKAIQLAGLQPNQIQYINAHATSTPTGDPIEYHAIKRLFGKEHCINSLRVSSTKGHIGHLLGAAGSVEAIATILSIKNVCFSILFCISLIYKNQNIIPATLNLEHLDDFMEVEEEQRMIVRNKPVQHEIENALSNSFGFGGTNAALLFSKFVL